MPTRPTPTAAGTSRLVVTADPVQSSHVRASDRKWPSVVRKSEVEGPTSGRHSCGGTHHRTRHTAHRLRLPDRHCCCPQGSLPCRMCRSGSPDLTGGSCQEQPRWLSPWRLRCSDRPEDRSEASPPTRPSRSLPPRHHTPWHVQPTSSQPHAQLRTRHRPACHSTRRRCLACCGGGK